MIRKFQTLEVVANSGVDKSERLAYKNNEYTTVALMNNMHLSNSLTECGVFDLFKNKISMDIELSEDIDSVSLVLCDKTEYISKNCSMTETNNRTTIVKIGTNLFAYTNDCEDVILVSKEDLGEVLKIFNAYAKIVKFEIDSKRDMKEFIKAELNKNIQEYLLSSKYSKEMSLIRK